jgi:hypothetical protein
MITEYIKKIIVVLITRNNTLIGQKTHTTHGCSTKGTTEANNSFSLAKGNPRD